jgi:hypothetical protein
MERALRFGARRAAQGAVQQCTQGHRQHHQREDAPEREVRHIQRAPDAKCGAGHRRHADRDGPSHRQHLMAVEPEDGAHVLRQHADPIGAVGHTRREAQEDQQRQGEERSAAGDDVDDGSHETDNEEGDESKRRHEWPHHS